MDTTTGISAAERSVTALKCVTDDAKPEDFRRPGHMFPLLAKRNGVLERNGHTEATVDLMRLAGLKECGLCCEIMREDGTMMRTPELMELTQKWGLKMVTIKALQEYRKRNDMLVEQVTCTPMPTKYGEFMGMRLPQTKTAAIKAVKPTMAVIARSRGPHEKRCEPSWRRTAFSFIRPASLPECAGRPADR